MTTRDEVLKAYAKVQQAKSGIGKRNESGRRVAREATDQVRAYLSAVQRWVAMMDSSNPAR